MRTFVRVCAFLVVLGLVLLPPAPLGLEPCADYLPPAALGAEEPADTGGAGYYAIPITGAVGRDFTAGQMEAHLKEAERLKPAAVLLEIDSGGGLIDHAEQIVDLIIKHKDLTFVAYVHKALSAAATVTLACEKIFVTESATIGGAVSCSLDEKGNVEELPADVAEKFQSIWRATCRKAAEHGGHPSLIAEAMVDPAFALTMRGTGEGADLERNGEGKVLKAKGRILTLTAREAVSCGLAAGLVEDVKGIGEQLAAADWRAVGGHAERLATAFDVPAVLGPEAFATPSTLYSFLYRKVVSLGLMDEQTEMQKEKAVDEWEGWFLEQAFSGQSVEWSMTLAEASEGEMRLVPGQESGAKPMIGGSRWGPNMNTKQAQDIAERAKKKAEYAKGWLNNINMVEADLMYNRGRTVKHCRKQINEKQETIKRVRSAQAASQAYPVKVLAKCNSEPRIFLAAWVGKRSKGHLLEIDPGEEMTLSGEIGKVTPVLSTHGRFAIEVILDQCELLAPGEEGPAPSEDQGAVECMSWLSMAKNFLLAGRPAKAIIYAEKVLAEYADSEYADEARAVRDQARQLQNPPSSEAEEPEPEP